MNKLAELHLDGFTQAEYNPEDKVPNYVGFAKESAEVTEQIAVEFAEWVDNMGYTQVANGLYKSLSDEKGKSTKEHESQVSRDVKRKDDIEVRFTTFGNRAGCRAVYDVIQMLDDDMKLKVVDMMRNKRVQ